jgi:hypothetical protein
VVLAWPKQGLGEPVFAWGERKFAGFARHRRAAVVSIGVLAIVLRLALLPWLHVPQPKVHDEFSYLLAADTFAHGRLANPPHPLWIFFDTFHVIQHPTYASMYPPAQGMVLAIGQLLGNPWIGVLLSVAAMCMAFTWMLQGWMTAEWALLGGLLVLSRIGVLSYWVNSYWGGAVAASGAAVVLGALPRIWARQSPRDSILLGLGAGVLATSRPVEGLTFCIPLGIALFWWVVRRQKSRRRHCYQRVIAPLFTVLICVLGFIAYYNWHVTGNPAVFPHLIEQRQYITEPIFLWQHAKPAISYTNPQFEDFYHNFLPSLYQPSWPAAEGQLEWKIMEFWQFFLGPALAFPFLALPWILHERRNWLLLIQALVSAIGLWIVVYYHAHYAAPLMATVFLLLLQCMREMRRWTIGGHAMGIGMTRIVVLFSLLIGPVYFVRIMAPEFGLPFFYVRARYLIFLAALLMALLVVRFGFSRLFPLRHKMIGAAGLFEFLLLSLILLEACLLQSQRHPDDYPVADDVNEPFRNTVERKLAALPGEHLVLVRYSSDHNSGEEYVYNKADIDNAKTVWAREIPGMGLDPLLGYFHNRDVWIYQPDEDDEAIFPYAP